MPLNNPADPRCIVPSINVCSTCSRYRTREYGMASGIIVRHLCGVLSMGFIKEGYLSRVDKFYIPDDCPLKLEHIVSSQPL